MTDSQSRMGLKDMKSDPGSGKFLTAGDAGKRKGICVFETAGLI